MNRPRNQGKAAYYRRPAANECPPVAGTTEGASIAVGANATAQYARGVGKGKAEPSPRIGRVESHQRRRACDGAETAYRASTGQVWRFRGKRARVLSMLATMDLGVTPWDCAPWHMRLGASIHVLREAGLAIDTVREGEYRHARYFLRTAGSLLIQVNNSGGAVDLDRAAQ